jgi:hypothetical protein
MDGKTTYTKAGRVKIGSVVEVEMADDADDWQWVRAKIVGKASGTRRGGMAEWWLIENAERKRYPGFVDPNTLSWRPVS